MMFNLVSNSLALIATVASLLFLQSCTRLAPIDPLIITEINNADNIITISQTAGKLTMLTPLGVTPEQLTLGLPEHWSMGKRLIQKFNIANPNETLKTKFMSTINKNRKISRFIDIKKSQTIEESSTSNLRAKYISGYALIFSPLIWEIQYLVQNSNHYQMLFNAKVNLIRIEDNRVIWSSTCQTQRKDDEPSPTLEQLLAEDSQVINDLLDKATTLCTTKLTYDFPKMIAATEL